MTEERAETVSMLEAALSYAARGWAVFPLAPRSKRPLTAHGVHDASTDPVRIRAWWEGYPDANVGLACGFASGVDVLDVDGPEGEAALAELEAQNGALPITIEARTARGRHLLFAHDEEARNTAGRLGPKLDTRADGGYIVAPPSVHPSGAVYAWTRGPDAAVAMPWPAWVPDAFRERRQPPPEPSPRSYEADETHERRYALAALEREERELADMGQGGRNDALNAAAFSLGQLVGAGALHRDEVYEALVAACHRNGLLQDDGQRQFDKTFRSGLEKGRREPRRIPEPTHNRQAVSPRPSGFYDAPLPEPPDEADGGTVVPFPVRDDEHEEHVDPMRAGAARVLHQALADLRRNDLHPSKVADRVASKLAAFKPKTPAKLPDMAALCRSQPGKYKRVPTGCAPLDAITGGGLQTKRIAVVGGAPGDLKTGLNLWIAVQIARFGAATAPAMVIFVAADEGRDGLLSRLGQMGGATRVGLEDEDLDVSESHWAHVVRYLADLPNLFIVDPGEDEGIDTVDDAIDLGHQAAQEAGARLVIVVDSLQAAPFRSDSVGAKRELSLREKIDARVATLKGVTKQRDALVIVVSELNRTAYGRDGQITLAAFKESGAIEYGVDFAAVLKRVPDSFCTDVHVVKNRLGDNGKFRMERAVDCTFQEVPIPDEGEEASAEQEQRDAIEQVRVEEMAEEILRALVTSKVPLTSRPDLKAAVIGGGSALKDKAISHLIAQGKIEGGRGRPYCRRYADEQEQAAE
jgi:KaiC/GvpD/RAD55 family RecA-like ATPase